METINSIKNQQGTYFLVLFVKNLVQISTRRFKWTFVPGYYFYFGSAKGISSNTIENRILRHFKTNKKIFWHIDHLTTHFEVDVTQAYYSIDPIRTECSALQQFRDSFENLDVILNFGSSDCISKCGGHLVYNCNNPQKKPELEDYLYAYGWTNFKRDDLKYER